MEEESDFFPVQNGALHEFIVTYFDEQGRNRFYRLKSKATSNALASFARAHPGRRIQGIRKEAAPLP